MIDESARFDQFRYLSLDDLKVMLRETVIEGCKEDIPFIKDLTNEIHRRELNVPSNE